MHRNVVRPRRGVRLPVSAAAAAWSGLVAGPVLAQENPAPTAPEVAQTEGLEEIIVTAQRRSEDLQEVPISVSAVTADTLRNTGIDATKDLPQLVPSVQVTRSGPSGLFFIRGVGTSNAAAGEEGANAFYVDGVYLGDLAQTINNFNNIERVEVLKGPQGTLFGRNATGGLIHVITREPGMDRVVNGQVGYANYDTLSGQLYAATPLSETLSADIALTASKQNEGWGENVTLGTDNKVSEFYGLRSKWVLRASEGLKFTLSGDYNESEDNLGLGWRIADGTIGTGGFSSPGGNDTSANRAALTKLEIWGASLTVEADLGFADLTSISAIRDNHNDSGFDVDGGPLNLINIDYISTSRTYQQELRLASTTVDPFSWQAGVFYLRSEAATAQTQSGDVFAGNGLQGLFVDGSLDTDSYAVFGEGSYALRDTTTLTAGLRYTNDHRDFTGHQDPILLDGTVITTPVIDATLKYNEATWRVALKQDLSDDVNVYASYNRGFKAGSFSLQNPTAPPVDPQYIDAYEVGIKSELLDRKLRLNMSAYHYDIDDYQVRAVAGATATSLLLNAATVKVDGVDVEFEALLQPGWRLYGGATMLKSKFDEFGGPGADFQAPIAYPQPATCPPELVGTTAPGVLSPGPRTGGYATCYGDVSGNRTALAPKFTGSIGTTYTLPAGADGWVRMTAVYNYNSGYYFEQDNVAKQDDFGLLNASIEYRPTDRWGIEIWGKNLTDTGYAVQNLTVFSGIVETFAAPRTYGANLKFDF